jgi:hypothetical protein
MLVQSRHPPFPPLLQYWQTELVSHSNQPGDGAGNGYAVVDVTLEDPHSKTFTQEVRVEPVASIIEHGVVGGDIIAAGVEVLEIDVHLGLDSTLVEEFLNAVHILADDVVCHHGDLAVDPPHIIFIRADPLDLLVEALGIEIEHAGVGVVELFIHNCPHLLAAIGVISQSASSSNLAVLLLSIVAMIV